MKNLVATYYSDLSSAIPALRWDPLWVVASRSRELLRMRGLEFKIEGIGDSDSEYLGACGALRDGLRVHGIARQFQTLFYVHHDLLANRAIAMHKIALRLHAAAQDVVSVRAADSPASAVVAWSNLDDDSWSSSFEQIANAQSAALLGDSSFERCAEMLRRDVLRCIRIDRTAAIDHYKFWPACSEAGLMSGQRYVGQDGEYVSFVVVGAAAAVDRLARRMSLDPRRA